MGSGTPYPSKSLDLFGRPELLTADVNRPDRGALAGRAVQGARTITGETWLDAWADRAQLMVDYGALAAAWRPPVLSDATDILDFRIGSQNWTYFGQARDIDPVQSEDSDDTDVWPVTWEYFASEPRLFFPEETDTLTTDVPQTITPPGNDVGIWRWVVEGPATIPALTITPVGGDPWTLAYGGNVPSGSSLIVSSRLRSATVGGFDKAGAFFDGAGRRQILIQFPVGGAAVEFVSHGGATTSTFITRGAL